MSKNLSIAYAMSKRPKKMADGGPVVDPDKAKQFIKGFTGVREHDEACPSCGYSKGGEVKGVHEASVEKEPGVSMAGYKARMANKQSHPDFSEHREENLEKAKDEHHKKLGEIMAMKAPKLKGLSDGGLVDRIMAKRMSKGGVASNEQDELADEMPNEFDDLVLDDNLDADYVGSEELGNEQESDDRSDIVSKILSSRRKKDKNPRPA